MARGGGTERTVVGLSACLILPLSVRFLQFVRGREPHAHVSRLYRLDAKQKEVMCDVSQQCSTVSSRLGCGTVNPAALIRLRLGSDGGADLTMRLC
jgi:hypothetical protein